MATIGYENISNTIIKSICSDITKPLSLIINQMFTTGILPDSLKIAKMILIFRDKTMLLKKICIVYQHFLHLIAISETDNKWCMIEANLTKSTWTTVIPNIHK